MSLKQKVFNGALWASASQALSMACNFVLTMVLAKGLSPTNYGYYFIALSTVVILVNVGTIGMDRVVVRFASMRIANQDLAGLRPLVFTCLGMVVLGAGVTCLAFWLFANPFFSKTLHMPELTLYLGVITVWLFSATVQGQLTETFRGLNDIRFASLFAGVRSNGILTALAVCGLMAAFWLSGRLTLSIALWIMPVTSVLIVITALIVLFAILPRAREGAAIEGGASVSPAPDWRARDALRESWPYWLTTIITALRLQGGAWLAGGLDTTDHVALYAVAQRMMILLVAPMIISNAVLPPIVAQLHSTDQLTRLGRVIRSISGLILLPSLVLMTVLLVGGKVMLHGLFGAYYEGAYPLLVVLCIGQTFNIATGAWQTVMPMTGNKRQMLVTSAIAMATQLSLGLILGHRYGVMGVAIGFSASIVITNLLGMFFVHSRLGIWTFASFDTAMLRDAAGLVAAKFSRRKPTWQRS